MYTVINFIVLFCVVSAAAGVCIFWLAKSKMFREKELSKPAKVLTAVNGVYNLLVLLTVAAAYIANNSAQRFEADFAFIVIMITLVVFLLLGFLTVAAGAPAGILTIALAVSCIKNQKTKKTGVICTIVSALSSSVSCACLAFALTILFAYLYQGSMLLDGFFRSYTQLTVVCVAASAVLTVAAVAAIVILGKKKLLKSERMVRPSGIVTALHGGSFLVLLLMAAFVIYVYMTEGPADIWSGTDSNLQVAALCVYLATLLLMVPFAYIGLPVGVFNTVVSALSSNKGKSLAMGIFRTAVSATLLLISCVFSFISIGLFSNLT